jgi:hypothetical protein
MKQLEIFILGCGKTGRELINRLDHHWKVTVFDVVPERFERLGPRANVTCIQGDATSEMVLRRANAEGARYAVACTTDDEANIAYCSLMRGRFDTPIVVSLTSSEGAIRALGKVGAVSVNRAAALAGLIRNRIETGIVESTDLGLGEGELLEVQLHESSYYAGLNVGDLPTRDFKVAVVYRENKLVLPEPDLMLLPRDRVVLVGRPNVVRGVAEAFLSGDLQFPAQYGNRILLPVFGFQPPTEQTIDEAIYLSRTSRASGLDVVFFPEGLGNLDTEALTQLIEEKCAESNLSVHITEATGRNLPFLKQLADDGHVGVVVLAPEKPGISKRIFGISFTASVVNTVDVPVLVARGSYPYKELIVPCQDVARSRRALEIAVDVSRLETAQVVALRIYNRILPVRSRKTGGPSQLELFLVELAKLHRKEVAVERVEGNPVEQVCRRAGEEETLVVLEAAGIPPRTILSPDVNYHTLHKTTCSALILPGEVHHVV